MAIFTSDLETKEERNKSMRWTVRIGIPSLLFSIAYSITNTCLTFQIMSTACSVNLGYSDDVCSDIISGNVGNYTDEQDNVNQLTATIGTWQSIIISLLPIICLAAVGPWSDKHGRKWAFAIPLLGGILASALTLLAYYVEAPAEALAALYSVPMAIFGGNPLFQTAIYSNLADVTVPARRTFWTAICLMFVGIGSGIGIIAAGIIYGVMDVWVYGVGGVLFVIILLYALFLIPNVVPESTKEGYEDMQLEQQKKTLKEKARGVLDSYVDLAKFVVKKRENNYRAKMLLLLLAYTLCAFSISGSGTVLTLFMNESLGWSTEQIGAFSGVSVYITTFGSVILVVPYFFIEMPDSLICAFSSFSAFLMYVIIPFAQSTSTMYAASAAGCLREIFIFIVKSLVSKMVVGDEIGKANALFSTGDTIGSMLAGPSYNGIFAATVYTFPGAFALLSCCLLLPATLIFLYIYVTSLLYRRRHRNSGIHIVLL